MMINFYSIQNLRMLWHAAETPGEYQTDQGGKELHEEKGGTSTKTSQCRAVG